MTTRPKSSSYQRIQPRIDKKVDAEVAARLAATPQPQLPETPTPPTPRGPVTTAAYAFEDAIAANERNEQHTSTIDDIRAKRAAGTPTPREQQQGTGRRRSRRRRRRTPRHAQSGRRGR